jgi:hypothetical protein
METLQVIGGMFVCLGMMAVPVVGLVALFVWLKRTGDKQKAAWMSQEKFQAIQPGMTFAQVVALVGKPEKEVVSTLHEGVTTKVYQWKGGVFAHATLTFQNDVLATKAQVGV